MEQISKTQKKKEAEALQEFGVKLVKLQDNQIDTMALPEEVLQAVKFAKTLKHGALRRQLQYIGVLMRKSNVTSIQEIIYKTEQTNKTISREFREVERWREELISDSDTCLEQILEEYPDANRQELTELVQRARKEKEGNQPQRSSRILFRYLKKLRTEASPL